MSVPLAREGHSAGVREAGGRGGPDGSGVLFAGRLVGPDLNVGPHQAIIGDIVIPNGPVISVTAESSGRRPFAVLTVAHHGETGYTRAVMPWEMAARLAGHLMRGHQSYAS